MQFYSIFSCFFTQHATERINSQPYRQMNNLELNRVVRKISLCLSRTGTTKGFSAKNIGAKFFSRSILGALAQKVFPALEKREKSFERVVDRLIAKKHPRMNTSTQHWD